MLALNIVISVNLLREVEMSSLCLKKGKSTRSTLFSYYVDDLCSIVCHKIDMEKALMKCHFEGQTLTIYVSVNVVVSDIPSVMNSTIYSETLTVVPAMSVGLRSSSQVWAAPPSLTPSPNKIRGSDLLTVIGRE